MARMPRGTPTPAPMAAEFVDEELVEEEEGEGVEVDGERERGGWDVELVIAGSLGMDVDVIDAREDEDDFDFDDEEEEEKDEEEGEEDAVKGSGVADCASPMMVCIRPSPCTEKVGVVSLQMTFPISPCWHGSPSQQNSFVVSGHPNTISSLSRPLLDLRQNCGQAGSLKDLSVQEPRREPNCVLEVGTLLQILLSMQAYERGQQ